MTDTTAVTPRCFVGSDADPRSKRTAVKKEACFWLKADLFGRVRHPRAAHARRYR